MIFVTVGTHEQPFDRLIKAMDQLKEQNIIKEDVFIQIGHSLYKPKFCDWVKFIDFSEMKERMANAKIIITHGGPTSILFALHNGKIPIVVPRQKKFKEHVDNHQVSFCKKLDEQRKIIPIFDVEYIADRIQRYKGIIQDLEINKSNWRLGGDISQFIEALDTLCRKLIHQKQTD